MIIERLGDKNLHNRIKKENKHQQGMKRIWKYAERWFISIISK